MTISLAFLAPDLVKAAVEGRLPRGIGVERLRESGTRISCTARAAAGADTYFLCEINASSCFAIPDEAPAAIARTVKIRLLGEFESSSLAAAPERSKG